MNRTAPPDSRFSRLARLSRLPARARLVASALGVASFLACLLAPRSAAAAPRWIDRAMTQPRLVFAGNVGLGVAHVSPPGNSVTGAGLNFEGALGITDSVELGLRTGARFGADGKVLSADVYGRTLWTETYGGGGDTFANPEFRVRWAFYSGRVVEVGLDGRVYMPFETNTRFGTMIGLPLAFHLGDILRIDTGVYVPIIATPQVSTAVTIPGYFWFQPSRSFFLGPMVAFRHFDPGSAPARTDALVGFGMGYQVHSAVDLKWMFFFPRVNDDDFRVFGAGFGVEFRIGE